MEINHSYHLVNTALESIRYEAQQYAKSEYGAIVFWFVSKSESAQAFIRKFNEGNSLCLITPIKTFGSMLLPPDYCDKSTSRTNCDIDAMLKILNCNCAFEHGHGYRSSDYPDKATSKPGAVAFDIRQDEELWLVIYVAVSSGNNDEIDERCALAAKLDLEMFVKALNRKFSDHKYALSSLS